MILQRYLLNKRHISFVVSQLIIAEARMASAISINSLSYVKQTLS